MRRVLLLVGLFLLAPGPLPASPGVAVAAAADGAGVKLLDCVPALEPQDRLAMFEARIAARRGSERMQLRFTLQVREPALEWRRVVAPGLDQWLTSDQGVRRYSYAKIVQNLSAPAAYRMVVRFRWLDADGDVLARSRSTSRPCRQPDMRPDIAAPQIEVGPAFAPESRRYAVTVRNGGRTAAGPFAVALAVGGTAPARLTVAGLEPGERRTVVLTGPACAAGEPLTVTVDPDDAVDERDEEDNVLVAACAA
jgi:hypothetical protein